MTPAAVLMFVLGSQFSFYWYFCDPVYTFEKPTTLGFENDYEYSEIQMHSFYPSVQYLSWVCLLNHQPEWLGRWSIFYITWNKINLMPSPEEGCDLTLLLLGQRMGAGVVVVDESPANQVLVVLDVLIETCELNHLHDDEAGEECDDQQCRVDTSLHKDLREWRENLFSNVTQSNRRLQYGYGCTFLMPHTWWNILRELPRKLSHELTRALGGARSGAMVWAVT